MNIEYIWINQFNKISNQGFNFSSQFKYTFEYTFINEQYTGDLIYSVNTEIIKDFFPENIEALTTIVGRNGSGKSTALEIILLIYEILNFSGLDTSFRGHSYKPYSFFIILGELNERYLIKHNFGEINSDSSIKYLNKNDDIYKNMLNNNILIRYSNLIDNYDNDYKSSSITSPKYKDLTSNGILKRKDSYQQYIYDEIIEQINCFYKLNNNSDYKFEFSIPSDLSIDIELNDYLLNNSKLSEIKDSLEILIEYYKSSFTEIEEGKGTDESLIKFMRNSFFLPFIFKFVENNLADESFIEGFPMADVEDDSKIRNRRYYIEKFTQDNFLQNNFDEFILNFIINIPNTDFTELIDIVNILFSNPNTLKEFKNITHVSSTRLPTFLLKINKDNHHLTLKLLTFLKSILRISWYNMSSGEKSYLTFYSRFLNLNNFKNAIILIDEIENSFHPQWQKGILNRIINFISSYYNDSTVQIITTSNSPFLISDLLPEHIIFMNKKYLENSKTDFLCVVDESKSDYSKGTFGANIHTLLTDSFFLENGVMGDYASTKIQKILDYIRKEPYDKLKNDYYHKLVNRIGERVIRNQLLYLLERKS